MTSVRPAWKPPTARERLALLQDARSIAIVGASANPARAANFVATYLLGSTSYDVWFVNPRETSIFGRPASQIHDSRSLRLSGCARTSHIRTITGPESRRSPM